VVVTATAGKTDAVKVLENLYRQFTTHTQAVAEICRAGGTLRLIQFADQIGENLNPIVTIITIFYDRRDQPKLGGCQFCC